MFALRSGRSQDSDMPPLLCYRAVFNPVTGPTIYYYEARADSPPNVALIVAYDVLYILSTVLLTALCIMTSLSRNIKRKEIWFLAMFSWWLASAESILILGQQVGPEPNSQVCLIQAMLTYGTPPFASLATAAFMIQTYYILNPSSAYHRTRIWCFLLHVVPILTFLCTMFSVILVGPIMGAVVISRDTTGMYCHVTPISAKGPSVPFILAGVGCAGGLAIILIVEYYIFKSSRCGTNPRSGPVAPEPMINLDIVKDISKRIMIFCAWDVFCMILTVVQLAATAYFERDETWNPVFQVIEATVPCAAIIITVTQKDMMNAVMFWKHKKKTEVA